MIVSLPQWKWKVCHKVCRTVLNCHVPHYAKRWHVQLYTNVNSDISHDLAQFDTVRHGVAQYIINVPNLENNENIHRHFGTV